MGLGSGGQGPDMRARGRINQRPERKHGGKTKPMDVKIG